MIPALAVKSKLENYMIIKKIRAITGIREYEIQSLNGIRALAIIFVILTHLWKLKKYMPGYSATLNTVMLNLQSGVTLFFILSCSYGVVNQSTIEYNLALFSKQNNNGSDQ